MTMQIAPLFDVSDFLVDISPECPCGEDTRKDVSSNSPYFNLKDLRSQARALERQILADDDSVKVAQWRQLAEAIPEVLIARSKDLEFVAWFIEALCREHGFAGLAQGFDLARGFIEAYWDQLHPQPDEEGLATRIAPLVGLNGIDGEGTLIQPILSIPLFISPALGQYAAWHAEQAAEVNRLDEAKAQSRIKAGAASPENLLQAVRETPVERLLETYFSIAQAQTAFATLSTVMDQAMLGEPQATTNIRKALERCKSVLMHNAGEQIESAKAQSPKLSELSRVPGSGDPAGADETPGSLDLDPVRVAVQSRKQALAQLSRLSDFFLQTEPHSPVSYAISQAIRWSELPLPELMQELIADSGARDGFCRITGVPAPGSQG